MSASLALLGAPPAFTEPLHVGRPNLGDRVRLFERWTAALDRRWLTNDGPLVREFEQRIAEFVGVKHCVALCNATIGLEIAIRALGLSGEVIVPSFTFIATAHALAWQGITPVFADIDAATHNLDPAAVEAAITPRTTGIIGTHVWGRACPVEELQQIADQHGLSLMFDAAHAFDCSYRNKIIGGFGRAEVFSFHATKFVNSGEGGALVTNDDDLARQARLMRNFGFAGYDRVVSLGTNGKMNELSAAMGLTSLESIDNIIAVNRRHYEQYASELLRLKGCRVLQYDPQESSNYQYVVVEIDAEEFGLTRDELVAVLHAENVLARRYFYPGCHRQEPYRSLDPGCGSRLTQTERVAERVLLLPTGTAVDEPHIDLIVQMMAAAQTAAPQVRSALATRASAAFIPPA